MMRFQPAGEPESFDRRCRQRGRAWLLKHPDYERPKDYWTEFEPELRRVFRGLCAYCCMRIMKGAIDHFVPVALSRKNRKHELAYEWSNYRYGDATLNGRKWAHRVLDPYQVRDEWFEILLPSLQLILTDRVPKRYRKLAEFTIIQLGLRDDEVVLRYRREWFQLYLEGKLTLEGLDEMAPLIARAVRRDLQNGKDWKLDWQNSSPGRAFDASAGG